MYGLKKEEFKKKFTNICITTKRKKKLVTTYIHGEKLDFQC